MARRKIDQVLRAAVLEELRDGAQARDVARKYGIAESTISRWRKAEGIDDVPYAGAVVRSKPLKVDTQERPEVQDDSAQRREMIRHMVGLVNDLATGGGLKSHDIKNLSMAAKVLSEADQREQKLLEEEQARSARERPLPKGHAADYDALVALHENGVPADIGTLFAVHDLEEAQLAGDTEAEEAAKERIQAGCRKVGLSDRDVPYSRMIQVADREHNEKFPLDT